MEPNIRSTDDFTSVVRALGHGLESISVDQAEQTLIGAEAVISWCRSVQMESLAHVDRAQVATADGAKNLSEWTAQRLDIGLDAARTLVRTMRRTHDRP